MGVKKTGPIILNYTGEIVRLKLDYQTTHLDPRVSRQRPPRGNETYLTLPPLGRATVTEELVKHEGELYPTVVYTIHGLPPKMPEVLYLVSENVAKHASRHRNDLMILVDVTVKSNKNPLKKDEMMLECLDFAHVVVDISED